jgi:hypothetical protein
METNREKFIRLAEKRVSTAIKTLRLIGNLSNKSNYSYSDSDIDKIFNTLQQELKDAKDQFRKAKTSKSDGFKLN